jgi:hypothetical protein
MEKKILISGLKRGQLVKMLRAARETSRTCTCGCLREDKVRMIFWSETPKYAEGCMSITHICEWDFKWAKEGHFRDEVKIHAGDGMYVSIEPTHYFAGGH